MLPSCFRVSATYRVSHLQRAAGSSVPTKKLPGTCFPEKRLFLLCLHALKLPSAYFVDAAVFLGTNFLPRSSSSLMKCQRSPLGSFLLNFSFLGGFRDGKAFSFSSPLLLSVHSPMPKHIRCPSTAFREYFRGGTGTSPLHRSSIKLQASLTS